MASGRRFSLALVAAAALVFGAGFAQASADTVQDEAVSISVVSQQGVVAQAECYFPVQSADGGAMVCWNPTGEHLYICDTASDGHHPAARYYRSDSAGLKSKHADVSYGNCLDHNLSLPESGWVDYQACNYEGSSLLSCSGFSGRISASG
jgi:hypothetical protein